MFLASQDMWLCNSNRFWLRKAKGQSGEKLWWKRKIFVGFVYDENQWRVENVQNRNDFPKFDGRKSKIKKDKNQREYL